MLAAKLLTQEQKRKVCRHSDMRGLWLVAHAWLVIGGSMAMVALWPNVFTFIAAVVLIGARQLGLAVLMHDAAHHALCRTPALNNFLGQWFCAFPVISDVKAYRRYHLKHHANTQQEDDPDLVLSAPFPITRRSLWRKIVRDLTGQTGYQQRKAQFLYAWGKKGLTLRQHITVFFGKLGKPLVVQAVIFTVLALCGQAILYPLLWLLPFVTYNQLIIRIRNIAEHAMVPDNQDPFRYARTTLASLPIRAVMAPYWVNYHTEHHLMMHVPCYRLPILRKFLKDNGFLQRMETQKSYARVLRLVTTLPNHEDAPGDLVHNARRKQRVTGSFGEGYKDTNKDAA